MFLQKEFLPVVFLLFFVLPVSAQSDKTINQFDREGKKQGWWIGTNDKGQMTYKGYFEHGIPKGTFFRYYEDSTVKAQMFYATDGKTVYSSLFYNDGDLAAVGKYVNTKKDSTWKFYSFYTGKLSAEENYQNGNRQGLSKKFYESGQLLEELEYSQDKKNGKWIQYFKNGKPSLSASYANDLRNGNYNTWYESGQMEISGTFTNNLMDGNWNYYDEAGKLRFNIQYKAGVAQGQNKLEEEQQAFFKKIDESKGKFPEPDETNFIPGEQK